MLADALRGAGLEVAGAGSGQEAIQAAHRHKPAIVIADIRLGDCSGLEVVDRLREEFQDLPAIFITGYADANAFAQASQRRPVELIRKPIDLARLRRIVTGELRRHDRERQLQRRYRRLRELTRQVSRQRRRGYEVLSSTCADLTATCRGLQEQIERQKFAIEYQQDLVSCGNEDEIFSLFFRQFALRSGPVYGVAMLCDDEAELQVAGRFGVPTPDGANFCQHLAAATVPGILVEPEVAVLDAMEHAEMFPESLRRLIVGIVLMVVPLMIDEGQLIGLAVLYRKGEQPFTADDVALARMIAPASAAAIRRL